LTEDALIESVVLIVPLVRKVPIVTSNMEALFMKLRDALNDVALKLPLTTAFAMEHVPKVCVID